MSATQISTESGSARLSKSLHRSIDRLGILFVIVFLIAGCASSSQNETQKWEPTKRASAHVSLGMDYLKRGNFDVAREEFDLAISIDPNSDEAFHAKGLLLAQTGFVDDAQRNFARAVRINRSNFRAANDYGVYLCQNDKVDTGVSILKKVEARPDNTYLANTSLGLAICFHELNQLQLSKQYFRTVLESDPRLPQALLPMAEILYREQNFLSARAFIERYINTGSRAERALIAGANIEQRLGDIEKARQYARELRRLYPNSTSLIGFKNLLGNG